MDLLIILFMAPNSFILLSRPILMFHISEPTSGPRPPSLLPLSLFNLSRFGYLEFLPANVPVLYWTLFSMTVLKLTSVEGDPYSTMLTLLLRFYSGVLLTDVVDIKLE